MMNKLIVSIGLLFLLQNQTHAQTDLPIDTLLSKDMSKPIVFYISGDGGFNSFSRSFMKQWNAAGFPVVALNSRSYFFRSKQPEVAAKAIADLLNHYLLAWKRNNVIVVGYSFGADVLPFIQTRLPQLLQTRIAHTILLSPSHTTDFEVHLFYGHSGSSVPAEINKLNNATLLVYGNKENDVPVNEIKNAKVTSLVFSGDHHYDDNVGELVAQIIKRL